MSEKKYNVNLNNGEAFNLVKDATGRWVSRQKLTKVYTLSTAGTDEERILYAFTAKSGSGQTYHYLLILMADRKLRCRILGDNFNYDMGKADLGAIIDPEAPITHAINYNQIVINGPGLSGPYHCFIGSTPVRAEKEDANPKNPDYESLDLFPGLVAKFEDRFVYSYRHIANINNAGTNPKVVTAVNTIACSGPIMDMFQGNDGMLYVSSQNEIRTLPPDGIAGGKFEGSIATSTGYASLNYRNAISTRRGVYGLSVNGLLDLKTGETMPLTVYKRNRKITEPVGAGLATDFRTGQMYAFDEGIIISMGLDKPFCVINQEKNFVSWWNGDGVSGKVVGVCRPKDGTLSIVFSNGVYVYYGNNPDCECGLACEIVLPEPESHNISDIIVTASGDGVGTIRTYVRGSDMESTSPFAVGSSRTNVSVWGTATAVAGEMNSTSHKRAVRSDGLYFEIGVGNDIQIQSVQIISITQGLQRTRG
jgi:hypothetical protein